MFSRVSECFVNPNMLGTIDLSLFYSVLQKVNSMHIYIYHSMHIYIECVCIDIYMECREREKGKRAYVKCIFTGADFPTVAGLQLVTAVGLQHHTLP